tara:strand:- start:1088 stop:1726 length:639 start_codon:yes stop_codon:yes gene_type:complete
MISSGSIEAEDLDREQGWAEGTSHRHMQRHSGNYHTNSNTSCPVCTHPDRAVIEQTLSNGAATSEDFAEEIGISSTIIDLHMASHLHPVIQRAAVIEIMPSAIKSAHDTISRVEVNMNRLDGLLGRMLDMIQNQMDDEDEVVDMKAVDTVIRLHKEVRDTLTEIGKWMEKAENIDKAQSVSILTVIQQVFTEKSPEVWRELRGELAKAGVLE